MYGITTAFLNFKHLLLHIFMNLVNIMFQLSMAEIENGTIYLNKWKSIFFARVLLTFISSLTFFRSLIFSQVCCVIQSFLIFLLKT